MYFSLANDQSPVKVRPLLRPCEQLEKTAQMTKSCVRGPPFWLRVNWGRREAWKKMGSIVLMLHIFYHAFEERPAMRHSACLTFSEHELRSLLDIIIYHLDVSST